MHRKRGLSGWWSGLAVLVLVGEAMAQTFGPATPLNTDALFDESDDSTPRLAASEAGTVVAVWLRSFPGGDTAILTARSTDRGERWSDPRAFDPGAASDGLHDQAAEVATDGKGTWIAVWQHARAPRFDEIRAARSSDDGLTWSPSALVRDAPVLAWETFPHIAFDGGGTWIAVWGSIAEGPAGPTMFAARSMDAGATWSPPVALSSGAAALGSARVACGPQRRCVVVWQSLDGIRTVRSGDGGATWSAPALLHATGAWLFDRYLDIATDGRGTFVVVWTVEVDVPRSRPRSFEEEVGIFAVVSRDTGATWSSPDRLSLPGLDASLPAIAADSHGNWSVVWQGDLGRGALAGDGIVARWSHDDAASWNAITAVGGANADAEFDGAPSVVTDGRGRWLSTWYSQNEDGEFDLSASRLPCGCALCEICDRSGACVAQPRGDCRRLDGGATSSLAMRDGGRGGARRLRWTVRGAGVGPDVPEGDPRFDTDVGLCVYGPDRAIQLRAVAPAGLHCGTAPCWAREGRGGWAYRRRSTEPDGVATLVTRTRSGHVTLRGRGPSLRLPGLPASVPLLAQLQTAQGGCWEVEYGEADVVESTPARFVARTDRARGRGVPHGR